MPQDFVMLGAGFSRAISDGMPLLPNLAAQVLDELHESRDVLAPFDNNLEQWLSYLSVDQPWLTYAENLRNRATFHEASRAVQRCVDRAEADVAYPDTWLERLVLDWCQAKSAVTTFNYDLLLERVTTALRLTDTWLDLYGLPLDERHPPARGLSFGASKPAESLYTLYKLHGSVNWAYGGFDAPPSERVVLSRAAYGWPVPEAIARPSTVRRVDSPSYDDLEPLIVPPTGTKGPYYGNRSLQAQWRRAFEALSCAQSVTIIGYSFPASDLVSRHFLSSAQPACRVTVVDRSEQPAAIVENLLPGADVTAFTGDSAVRQFVEAEVGDVVRWGAEYSPEGWKPRLVVNDNEERLDPAPNDFDPMIPSGQLNSAMQWLDGEVARRYPDMAMESPYQSRRPGDNADIAWRLAYTGRRNTP